MDLVQSIVNGCNLIANSQRITTLQLFLVLLSPLVSLFGFHSHIFDPIDLVFICWKYRC